jgi:Co/Zn/Cd efflux system component
MPRGPKGEKRPADAIGNAAAMIAAAGVWGTGTPWPDLGVAALMAGIFATSSAQILRQAFAEFRDVHHAHPLAAE